jgi:hypothetical protein
MPRRLKPEQQLELDSLYRIVAVITHWYDTLVSRESRGHMSHTVRAAYEARDLRGMRMAYNDLVEMTRYADVEQRRDLDVRLRAGANTDLATIDAKTTQRVERIRARGRITSEEQYYLVREHVEFNFDAPDKTSEVQQLLVMLGDFEERSATRPKRRRVR